jgi:hypothetical protein
MRALDLARAGLLVDGEVKGEPAASVPINA